MAYLLRDESGTVEVVHDRHVMGLFSRAVWLELIAAAGFEPLAVPFEHSSYANTGHEVFLGLRAVAGPRQHAFGPISRTRFDPGGMQIEGVRRPKRPVPGVRPPGRQAPRRTVAAAPREPAVATADM